MSRAYDLLRGAAWLYSTQVASVLLQFGYAAATSRLLSPDAFGTYAVALTAIAAFNLVASAGLGQAASTLEDPRSAEALYLLRYSILLGAALGAVAFIVAAPVSRIWGVPEAASTMQVLAATTLLTPVTAVASGLLRRIAAFRYLATVTLACNATGMLCGAILVFHFRSPQSLVCSAIISSSLLLIACIARTREFFRRPTTKITSTATRFSRRILAISSFQYILANLNKFSVGHVLGPSALGHWNRAEVVGSLPFQQLQAVIISVCYPEFRHDAAFSERTLHVWTRSLGLLAWIMFPLGAIVAALQPLVVPVVFGPQWSAAADYAVVLTIAGCLQPTTYLLYAGLEATGNFGAIWRGNFAAMLVQVALVAAVVLSSSAAPAVAGLLATNMVIHAVHLRAAAKGGFVVLREVVRDYLLAGCLAATVALWLVAAMNTSRPMNDTDRLIEISLLMTLAAAACGIAFRRRSNLRPASLLRELMQARPHI